LDEVELEVDEAVEDAEVGGAVASVGIDEVENIASLVALVAAVDAIDVELDAVSRVDAISEVEAELVGDSVEDVVSDVATVVPGLVALEVRLLPPVDVAAALVVE
jgi:hypothetical protein